MSKRRHVFISHHHADDDHVTKLTSLLGRNGFEIRNSSIRAKPSNQARLDAGKNSGADAQAAAADEDVVGRSRGRPDRQGDA